MVSTTVEAIQALNNQNILKLQAGAAIFGDSTAPLITSLFASDGTLNALPDGYESAGLIDTGGITVNRTLTVSEVMSWQSVEDQRSDVDSDKLQFLVKFQESLNPVVNAIQEGKTIAEANAVMGGATTNYSFDKDQTGVQPSRRCLLIAHDTLRDVIVARYLPNVSLFAIGSKVWQRTTEDILDVTFNAYVDPVLGTSSRYFVGGAGLAAILGGDAEVPPAWIATHAYTLGQLALVTGKTLKVTTAGTSAGTIPTAPATIGGTVVDSGVTWTRTA